jgi:F420-dependent oxidoreductase-like protein
LKIGLHIGKFHWPGSPANLGPKLIEIAQAADQGGLASLWVMDHLFQLGEQYGAVHGPPEEPMLEGYSALAYLAGVTRHIRLGLLVTSAFYRPPGLLVKIASTIDALAGGRTYLGLGAGWFGREALGLGLPFPPLAERFERLEETLQIVRQMWAGDRRPYRGKHYQLAEPLNSPQPAGAPHPPILVGGGGERKTLRLVAQYADACNFVIPSPLDLPEFGDLRAASGDRAAWCHTIKARLSHKLSVLQEHCQAVDRPYAAIEKTVVTYIKLGAGGLEPAELVEICGALAELGFQHAIFNMPDVDTIAPLELLGRTVVPAVAPLA